MTGNQAPEAPKKEQEKALSVGAITGITIGAVAGMFLILVLLGVLYGVWKNRQRPA